MLFFDGMFLIFLLALVACFSIIRSLRARVGLLLVASYVFYAAWDWRFLVLIFGSTLLDFAVGRALPAAETGRRRGLLALSLAGNLGVLAVFKYADFGIETMRTLLGVDWGLLSLTLPVGISFYTFQSMSYTIDIYRRLLTPEPSFARFALYVSFFPQLVAGPIIRARTFLPQIDSALTHFPNRLSTALPLFTLGLFKKVAIADNLALIVDPVFAAPEAAVAADVVLATLAFAGQIYCDFSGYTDMALALGAFFGFRLPDNFHSPYLSRGPREFWRRWHISLSTWLRDYLYIPIGGSRRGRARTLLALAITMLLGGLWHGAAWTFVAWGAYHGAMLIGERLFEEGAPKLSESLAPLGTALFFPLTLFGWLLFRAASVAELRELLAALARPGEATVAVPIVLLCTLFIAAEHVIGEWARRSDRSIDRHPRLAFLLAGLALPLCVLLRPNDLTPFIYFQF